MMSEFPIELVVKQTLRSVVFDSTNMGIMSSKAEHFQTRNNTTNFNGKTLVETAFWNILRSPETLKLIYDKPNEYINKIYENDTFQETLREARDENELQIMKHRILYSFLQDVRDSRPPPAMEWVAFQHYMYFMYRHFISAKPIITNEILPNILVKKMYELVLSLTHEDKTQFYVRIVTLLREYVMTARGHFEAIKTNSDITIYLTCLLSYYSAFCSAANKLSTVLAEFDQFINNRFHINWYCLNQRMFFQYFFMSPSVQSKVQIFNELLKEDAEHLKKLLEHYKGFMDDMTLLDRHWEVQRRRITILSAHYLTVEIHTCSEKNDTEECQWLQKDWKMFSEITRIMKTNYWIIRNEDAKAIQDMNELDGHILALVGDTWYIADRIITSCGYCICEDCMSAEFKGTLPNSIPSLKRQVTTTMNRLVTCYICHDVIVLEALASHIVTKHADLSIPRADLTKTYEWHISPSSKKGTPTKRPSTQFCKVLTEAMELAKQKDSQIFKVCNEHVFKMSTELESKNKDTSTKNHLENSVQLNNSISLKTPNNSLIQFSETKDFTKSILSESNKTKDSFQVDIEPVMKIASEAPKMTDPSNMEESRINFEKIVETRKLHENISDNKKSLVNGIVEKPVGQCCVNKSHTEIKNWHSNEVKSIKGQENLKVADNKKSTDHQSVPKTTTASQANCVGHICGHKCKEEGKHSCDHKEVKKCDCAYCEVFGSSIPSHTVKSNETRDRLRTRLNQRKQTRMDNKISAQKSVVQSSADNKNNIHISKIKLNKMPTNNKSLLPTNVQTNSKSCLHNDLASDSSQNGLCVIPKPNTEILAKIDNKTLSTDKINKPNMNDINELLNFIEGHKNIDKLALAEKKAAKKARQKLKKEQEKQKKEEEELAKKRLRILEEEKRKMEERLKAQALAKMQAEQQRKMKKCQDQKELGKSGKKKKKNKQKCIIGNDNAIELMEETIPAMVTIKRIVENNNSPPTVTITLKGSTPDQDKLLYTLVNGHTNDVSSSNENSVKSQKQELKIKDNKNEKKTKNKKKEKLKNETNLKPTEKSVTSSELKVTLSVDKSFRKVAAVNCESKKEEKPDNCIIESKKSKQKKEIITNKPKDNDLDIPSLKLPPGITITKVNGPIVNKTCKTNGSVSTHPYQSVPVNKSGVIVVETEKLIQQSMTNNVGKKNKKKKNKTISNSNTQPLTLNNDTIIKKDTKPPKMVTLKNPIFHNLRSRFIDKANSPILTCTNEQASITKGENGMVTIRRPKCIQIPIENESPMSEFLNELKPVVHSDISTSYAKNSVSFPYKDEKSNEIHTIISQSDKQKSLSAHDILWGLPGIEITKVNKTNCFENEVKKANQTADVSIIPTGGNEKFNFDRDDWPFESVFTPKDISEEDLDAEERELEAFKRFCQQSVPPKHKEKVAHLNVKDIVLKKKNDVTYS